MGEDRLLILGERHAVLGHRCLDRGSRVRHRRPSLAHRHPPAARGGAGLLVAVFVAEGARNALVLSYPIDGAMFIIAGLLLPLILGRTREVVGWAYVAAVPMVGLGALGYLAFIWMYGLITGT